MEKEKLSKMQGKLHVEDGKDVFKPYKVKKVKFERYAIINADRTLLYKHMASSRSFSDMITFDCLVSCIAVETGLANVKQKDVVELTGVSKARVSESMRRLLSTVDYEVQRVSEIVREYHGSNGRFLGYIVNPDIAFAGDHVRAYKLWSEAGKQQIAAAAAKIKSLTEQTIERTRQRVEAGEEVTTAIYAALDEIKDAALRAEVRWTVEDAF